MIPIHVSLSHYKRQDVREEIVYNSQDREVAARFNDRFGKRPDVLRHGSDILELAKQGVTSFHASEELWTNPLSIDSSLKRHELDNLRKGWDLIIDIDCPVFEYSKIGADLVVKALRFHKVNSVSCKFSGNKGFHIGVPFEAFPDKVHWQDTRILFPEAPKKIANYLKHMIMEEFGMRILAHEDNDISKILEKTGKSASDVISIQVGKKKFNPESILEMDTLLISPRHLFRMPYSLHEKSGLVSVPFNPDSVIAFDKKIAEPSSLKISDFRFLDRSNVPKEDAKQLFVEAFDFGAKEDAKTALYSKKERNYEELQDALPEELFPPCIKIILDGMGDGRKRALFILVNYLTSIGWDYERVEAKLKEWNSRNKEPLKEVYLLGQVRYHKQMKKRIPPPNCANEMYMVNLGVCKPDNFCPRIKNPAQYSTRKAWAINNATKGRKKEKESASSQSPKDAQNI